ncbi:MAG: hypothetical protein HND52_14985 [Ignavibacteriae bacterium]|nr:hypothetical protein [Ignavibacteriota bacterium]NOG99259.1 hypothetical protein [Ignavibacteriota bacterium]
MRQLLVLFCIPIFLSAQSEFLNENQSGFNANFGYVANSILSGTGASFGASVLGVVDFSGEFINASLTDNNDEYSSSSYLFYIAYNIKRRNNFNNLKLLVGYISSRVKADKSNSGVAVGANFSIRAYENQNVALIPSFSFIYGFVSASKYNSYYRRKEDNYLQNAGSIALDLNLKLKLTKNVSMIVTPAISKDLVSSEYSISYSISGGILVEWAGIE